MTTYAVRATIQWPATVQPEAGEFVSLAECETFADATEYLRRLKAAFGTPGQLTEYAPSNLLHPRPSMNRIIVSVEGGVICGLAADRPEDVEVYVVDFDADQESNDEVRIVAGHYNSVPERAQVSTPAVTTMDSEFERWIVGPFLNQAAE